MYEVDIKIGASAKEYWASLEFMDDKNKPHKREIREERSASKQSNTLEALIAALRVLKTPCMLNIYSAEDYLVAPFQQGWINSWSKYGWKSSNGREIRNTGQWRQIWELLAPHSRRVMKLEGE